MPGQRFRMWLLPVLSGTCRLAARTFYQLSFTGATVPPRGPVLLVGNHPNALLDPALLAAAARRPVRFLAKAPLFEAPQIGWLLRAAGCIPVYRRQDDPALMERNADSFRAVEDALYGGSAIGLFPEGISHDAPSLAQIKTGAARIALATARRLGRSFPIVPVGIMLREKTVFRSKATVAVGVPIVWDDLVANSADTPEVVHELTRRIEGGLRKVTLNLERWEDRPAVECGEAIYAAELDAHADRARRVERLQVTADILARLRREGDVRWQALAEDLQRHDRRLRWLGIRPADLTRRPGAAAVVHWGFRTLPATVFPAALVAALGIVIFWLPYHLTGTLANRLSPGRDSLATYKVLGGIVVFSAWIGLLSAAAVALGGWLAGVVALAALPLIGATTLAVVERWRASREDVRRFFTVRRSARIAELREEQRALAQRLQDILRSMATPRLAGTTPGTSGYTASEGSPHPR